MLLKKWLIINGIVIIFIFLSGTSISLVHTFKNSFKTPIQSELGVLLIPKLDLYSKYFQGNSSMTNLDQIILAPYASLPSDPKSNVILMAHSGNGTYSYFKDIDKLEARDLIILSYHSDRYTYVVKHKKIINPNDIYQLHNKNYDSLTLVTCFKHYRRLIIIAYKKQDD